MRLDFSFLDRSDKIAVFSRPYEPIKRPIQSARDTKPEGLWYGYGSSWLDYIFTEGFDPSKDIRYGSGKLYIYKVEIDMENVLHLRRADVELFSDEYGIPNSFENETFLVNWKGVAKIYDGIDFKGFYGHYYGKSLWYSTVSIESGCIWNPKAVVDIQLVKKITL